jgi:transcription elongation factor Elf1
LLKVSAMRRSGKDFVLVIDELKREGKVKISPISKQANSFECPKCGNLISPENPDSHSELEYKENTGALVRCKKCGARIELLWQTDLARSICEKFRKTN